MTEPSQQHDDVDRLQREALAWVVRLTSGEATVDDAAALGQWRASSPSHEAAFRDAARIWKLSGAAARAMVGASASIVPAGPQRRPVIGRRALLLGSLAASAAAVAVLAAHPPLGLWPSLEELSSDFRTAKGERRQVALSDGITLDLNTQTSMTRKSPRQLELVAGEAIVSCHGTGAVELTAGEGRVVAERADFSARRDGSITKVVCLTGEVAIDHPLGRLLLTENRQARYSAGHLGGAGPVDAEAATSWKAGVLIFKNRPLAEVVEDVNRYRSGRIMIVRADLAALLVNATFHLDRLDDVVAQIKDAFGVTAISLPGGVVLLG